jgi:preprotein translocase subunit SecB
MAANENDNDRNQGGPSQQAGGGTVSGQPEPAAPADATQDPAEQPAMQIGIKAQYVKDLSFENPGAPDSLMRSEQPPEIQVNVEVQSRPIPGDVYEVMLRITANAQVASAPVFVLDLSYSGVFAVIGVPAEALEPVLLIECPRLLFPFARRVVADATRDGGFPPLMLTPIDFLSLYRQQRPTAQPTGGAQAQAPAPSA